MILERKIPLWYLLGKIQWDIVTVTFFAAVMYILDRLVIDIKLPMSIPAFLGTAISLLLSFKLSQSYDRWWEARKIWGAIVNDSRSLVLQLRHFCRSSGSAETSAVIRRMALRQIGWCYALAKSLRKLDPREQLDQYLPRGELEKLGSHSNVPLALVDLNLNDLKQLHQNEELNDYQQVQVDGTFVRLVESMGKAERIKNTVFPRTYRMFLHLFIYVFLFTLTVALTELKTIFEIPLMILIAIPFFLLEKTAFYMQDPFENKPTDTSMTAISRTIEINIKQLLDEEEVPEPLTSGKFYLM